MSVAAAMAVFLVVQDRVTAAGVRRYVALQRSAVAGETPRVTIDEVMGPAVERSVRQGVLWGGVVLVTGLVAAAVASRGGPPTGGPPGRHRFVRSRSDQTGRGGS